MEPSKEMKEYFSKAAQHGANSYNETMRQVLALPNPAEINYEIASMEEFAITCLAHHVFNHGIGAHYSTVTPFGQWNASQAYVKEQELAERILKRSKQVKEQYMQKKGTLAPIDPEFKNETDKFKEGNNENAN